MGASGNGSDQSHKIPKPNKNEEHKRDADDRLRDLPDWLQPFTDNLADTETSASAQVSQDSDSERTTKVAEKSRKHGIFTHFPKCRDCDACLRTKITRAPCRRRTGEASIPRAEKFGDLITEDHKVLNKEGESRNNHRYAVVVLDLPTQWIQSYPCRTTSQETEKSLPKFLEPSEKPKVIYTDISLEFGKSCEEFSWNHRTSTPHRSETNGIAERAVRRVKEGTSAVLLQCSCYLRNVEDLLADVNTPYERRFGEFFKGPIIPFGAMVEYHPISARDQSRLHHFGKEGLTKYLSGICLDRGRNLGRRYSDC